MARTYERPCPSLKNEPTTTGSWPMALKDTEIGLLPVWSRSFLPGLPTYLQTERLVRGGVGGNRTGTARETEGIAGEHADDGDDGDHASSGGGGGAVHGSSTSWDFWMLSILRFERPRFDGRTRQTRRSGVAHVRQRRTTARGMATRIATCGRSARARATSGGLAVLARGVRNRRPALPRAANDPPAPPQGRRLDR